MHTTEQAAEPGPTPRPSKHCRGGGELDRGGSAGPEETKPGERPLQTREGSDKQPSVEREEKGEWRERSLIKQLEGAMIYPSMGGIGEKERVN